MSDSLTVFKCKRGKYRVVSQSPGTLLHTIFFTISLFSILTNVGPNKDITICVCQTFERGLVVDDEKYKR